MKTITWKKSELKFAGFDKNAGMFKFVRLDKDGGVDSIELYKKLKYVLPDDIVVHMRDDGKYYIAFKEYEEKDILNFFGKEKIMETEIKENIENIINFEEIRTVYTGVVVNKEDKLVHLASPNEKYICNILNKKDDMPEEGTEVKVRIRFQDNDDKTLLYGNIITITDNNTDFCGKIYTGKISAVTLLSNNKPGVVVCHSNHKIIIPAEKLVTMSEEEKNDLSEMKNICEERLGATIDFKVIEEDCEGDMPTAIASRIDAMKTIRDRRWFGENKIIGGEMIEGRVVCVKKDGIIVEVAGVETFVPNSDFSFTKKISDARELFHIDDIVKLQLKGIRRDVFTNEVEFEASVEEINPCTEKEIFDNIEDQSLCSGEIAKVIYSYQQGPKFLVWLDQGYSCLCKETNDCFPRYGDHVMVRIKKIEKDMTIVGSIQAVLK